MSDRVDLDDWFAERAQPSPTGDGDDWLAAATPETRPPPRRSQLTRSRQWAIGAAALVAALVLALWAAGVFSGGHARPRSATVSTTQQTPTATAPARAPATAPTATLTPGTAGVQVKRLQRALTALGYAPGKVDGSYGPATVAAVRRFQRAQRLQADGVLGPKTLRALRSALAASP